MGANSRLGAYSNKYGMYDLPNAVQFRSVESYVDDTKIFLSFSSKDVDLSLERNSEDLRHAAK